MNLLDLFILIPILYFCYRGVRNGLVGEILGIIGIIVAVYLTFHFMDKVADILNSFIHGNPDYLPFVAGAIIFISTLIILQVIAFLLNRFLKFIKLHTANRILGLFFGAFKGAIIVSAVLILLAGFNRPSERIRKHSVSYSYIIYLAPWAYNIISGKNFLQTLHNTFEKYTPIDNFPIKE